MLVGYARVSTTDQTLHLQHDSLTKAGCTKIFTDTASGAQAERKGLIDALSVSAHLSLISDWNGLAARGY